MYHDISPDLGSTGGGPQRFAVPLEEFRRQLDQVQTAGYGGRSLREALRSDAGPVVAITFDDGDSGQFERGFRALVERSMTATFFVTTNWIGRPGYVSWAQLREMRAAGMEVQSHSSSHPFLSELGANDLTAELRGSKDVLDDGLAQDTDMLALPGGDWPRRALRGLIAAAGYRVVATSRWGTNTWSRTGPDSLAEIRRCTVQGVTGAEAFKHIITADATLGRRRLVRETTLALLRRTLGPTRYAAWRKTLLDALD
jgi:peptidoglycan/xylan/chitin deacetylase (PgdA/CDA1 family)